MSIAAQPNFVIFNFITDQQRSLQYFPHVWEQANLSNLTWRKWTNSHPWTVAP